MPESTTFMLLMLDDLNDAAREEFLTFMQADESDYEHTPIAVVVKAIDTQQGENTESAFA